MEIIETRDRTKVEKIYLFSRKLVSEGLVDETKNWESNSPWHNSKFLNRDTGQEWVVYLADQAWPGEVKFVSTKLENT